jgi:ribonuclease-3
MNNIKNKLITRFNIESIINRYLGDTPIRINNLKHFQRAFVHKSFCIVDQDNSDSDNCSSMNLGKYFISDNERLEFLGDKVIDLITTEYLFDKYPEKDEGFLTKLKSKLVRKESLSALGDSLGFRKYILISSHIERISGRNNQRFLEDIFESFVGILYKDQKSDLNICKKFILGVYNEFIDIDELIKNNDNYKDSLLRLFHSKAWNHPVYDTIYYTGNVYAREFTVIITLSKEKFAESGESSETVKLVAKHQSEMLKVIKSENEEEYTKLVDKLNGKDNSDGHVLLGMGKSNTKKSAEQACSKDCLENLRVSVNY